MARSTAGDDGATAGDHGATAGAHADLGTEDAQDRLDDLAMTARLIDEQRARVAAATDVDARVLFGAWGVAWLLGYGALWLASLPSPRLDGGVATAFFTALLLGALTVTALHLARQAAGIRGASAVQGAMYGWSWALSFLGVTALAIAVAREGVDPVIVQLVMSVVSPLLVGALYMAGAAIWGDRTQFALGAWIALATTAAALAGMPMTLLLMSVAGGGGMLAAAAADAVRRARGRGPR